MYISLNPLNVGSGCSQSLIPVGKVFNRVLSLCVMNHVTTGNGVLLAIVYNGDVYCFCEFCGFIVS